MRTADGRTWISERGRGLASSGPPASSWGTSALTKRADAATAAVSAVSSRAARRASAVGSRRRSS